MEISQYCVCPPPVTGNSQEQANVGVTADVPSATMRGKSNKTYSGSVLSVIQEPNELLPINFDVKTWSELDPCNVVQIPRETNDSNKNKARINNTKNRKIHS